MTVLPESEKYEVTSISLPPKLKRAAEAYGREHGLSLAAVMRMSLSLFLPTNYLKKIESHPKTEGTNS